MTPRPPESLDIALKEWVGVCAAISEGRQTVLIRKGGIAERGGVFRPEHPAFWLYPTYLHESQQGIKPGEGANEEARPLPDLIRLTTIAVVDWAVRVGDLETAVALDAFHVWTTETIRKRFAYRAPGVWVFAIRAYVRDEPVEIAERPEYAGCKSWVGLDEAVPVGRLTPILTDAAAADGMRRLQGVLERCDRTMARVERGDAAR